MRAFISALFLMFLAVGASASSNNCTPWVVKDLGSTCLMSGGAEGLYYVRQCENEERICRWRRSGPMEDCDKVQLCTQDDPNAIVDCGPWRQVHGITCMDRQTRQWGPKWTRSCVIGGMTEEHCSRTPPPGTML